jgi:hypothetical protein
MKIQNTTDIPTPFLRQLTGWVFKELGCSRSRVPVVTFLNGDYEGVYYFPDARRNKIGYGQYYTKLLPLLPRVTTTPQGERGPVAEDLQRETQIIKRDIDPNTGKTLYDFKTVVKQPVDNAPRRTAPSGQLPRKRGEIRPVDNEVRIWVPQLPPEKPEDGPYVTERLFMAVVNIAGALSNVCEYRVPAGELGVFRQAIGKTWSESGIDLTKTWRQMVPTVDPFKKQNDNIKKCETKLAEWQRKERLAKNRQKKWARRLTQSRRALERKMEAFDEQSN